MAPVRRVNIISFKIPLDQLADSNDTAVLVKPCRQPDETQSTGGIGCEDQDLRSPIARMPSQASQFHKGKTHNRHPQTGSDISMAQSKPAAGRDLRIVSVGQARLEPDGGVRLPLVLGDEDGQSSSVVLSLRLDALLEGGGD